MRVDANRLYDVLRDYALEYARLKVHQEVWEHLWHLGNNEAIDKQCVDYGRSVKEANDKLNALMDICELQKDEEKELDEILHYKLDEHEILKLIAYWLRDMDYANEFFESGY